LFHCGRVNAVIIATIKFILKLMFSM